MPTPTMSLRALPEHHQLIRRMARALMERPELAEALTALIEGATQGVPQDATRPNPAVDQRIEDIERRLEQLEGQAVSHGEAPDVLPAIQPAIQDLLLAIQQRQLQQEETTRKVMAFAKSINGRVIEALGQLAKSKAATPPQHSAATQPPRSETSQPSDTRRTSGRGGTAVERRNRFQLPKDHRRQRMDLPSGFAGQGGEAIPGAVFGPG
jgi:hypothetical protein